MNILGVNISWRAKKEEVSQSVSSPQSMVYIESQKGIGHKYPVYDTTWDGEKTLGELGVIKRAVPDYKRLRYRMYHAYATIDSIKTIASKFFYWTIGNGLKLQSEPDRTVLESEGIVNSDAVYTNFQKMVEARFRIYASSKQSDYSKESSLHDLALNAYQGMFLGGDMLCIVRFEDYGPTMQVVSGEHVISPNLDGDYIQAAEKRGNKIKHGVEIDKKGSHVAYYVCTKDELKDDSFERIEAYGKKSGERLAWMVSGTKISPDHIRSVPQMSQSLEKINKLDRYTEAAVTKAEQGAKMVYTIEHQEYSTGENPLNSIVAGKRREAISGAIDWDKERALADGLANRLTETTSGQAINMPNGSTMKSFESSIETKFSEFNSTIRDEIAAGSDVPPEVAMQKYSSNYSASRAAINSFGYIIVINRTKFSNEFYLPYYKIWLKHQILIGKISAPGYIENQDNFMVTESYSKCRFTGKNMPHIDPLKEVKAVREMLGLDDKTPLISREQAVEMLDAGQWDENFLKYLEELNIVPKEMKEDPEAKKTEESKK